MHAYLQMGRRGFTLLELLVVIAIIGLLSTIVFVFLASARENAYFARAKSELLSIHEALEFYLNEHQRYPRDVFRDIPPGLEEYLSPGNWPRAPWPGSAYDWDAWPDRDTGEQVYQISIRFCTFERPDTCRFPKQEWAEDFDQWSSVYYCIQGPCRPHENLPRSHPGYCVNCEN